MLLATSSISVSSQIDKKLTERGYGYGKFPKGNYIRIICTLGNWRKWNLLQAKSFVLIKILGINIAVKGTFFLETFGANATDFLRFSFPFPSHKYRK